jgi:transposase
VPTERIAMRQIRELLRLKYECRLSHARIARALGLSKGVVAKYVKLATRAGLTWEEARALDEVDLERRVHPSRSAGALLAGYVQPDFAFVHQELKRKGVTLALLWEEYVGAHAGPTYRYSRFCDHYREFAQRLKRSMRQVHRAGEKLFVDYAGDTVPIVDASSGEIARANIFVAVLGASNYTFACATATQSQADWLGAIGRALSFIGGVVEMIVPDNTRALIAHPDRYEPLANRAVEEFAAHYATVILPARPYRARDKAAAEVAVLIVQRWVLARLRHRRFFSLDELNAAIAELVVELNARAFKKLPGSRVSAFARLDRPALKPLPATAFQYSIWKKATVNIDYHVEVQGHYYSVPYQLVRQPVEVRLSATSVECFVRGKRVAAHARSTRRGGYSTLPEHMPASHRAHREWSPGRLLNWALSVGPKSRDLVHHLLDSKPHPEQGYRACLGLMRLARQYGNARLEAACARAIAIHAPAYRSVASILKAGLDRQPLPHTEQAEFELPAHANVRGPRYYH